MKGIRRRLQVALKVATNDSELPAPRIAGVHLPEVTALREALLAPYMLDGTGTACILHPKLERFACEWNDYVGTVRKQHFSMH